MIHRHDCKLTLRIERHSAPMRTADVRWQNHRSLKRRRREYSFVLQSFQKGIACWIEPIRAPAMRAERRNAGERLRRPCPLTRNSARRYGAFVYRKDGHARFAVQNEHHPCFGSLNNGRLSLDRAEQRGRRVVVIPQVMVYRLEMPYDFSCRCAESNDGICVVIPPQSFAPEIVGTGRASGNEYKVTRGICGNDRPGVRGAGSMGVAPLPCRVCGIRSTLRDWIPRPPELSRSRIVARTSPVAASVRLLSAMAEPMMTRSLITAGGR